MDDKTTLERTIENKLKKEIEKIGGLYFKFVSPGNKGVPDRIAIFPDGMLYFIELKRPKGGRYTPLQEFQQKRLKSYNQLVRCIKSTDEIKEFIKEVQDGIHTT